ANTKLCPESPVLRVFSPTNPQDKLKRKRPPVGGLFFKAVVLHSTGLIPHAMLLSFQQMGGFMIHLLLSLRWSLLPELLLSRQDRQLRSAVQRLWPPLLPLRPTLPSYLQWVRHTYQGRYPQVL